MCHKIEDRCKGLLRTHTYCWSSNPRLSSGAQARARAWGLGSTQVPAVRSAPLPKIVAWVAARHPGTLLGTPPSMRPSAYNGHQAGPTPSGRQLASSAGNSARGCHKHRHESTAHDQPPAYQPIASCSLQRRAHKPHQPTSPRQRLYTSTLVPSASSTQWRVIGMSLSLVT